MRPSFFIRVGEMDIAVGPDNDPATVFCRILVCGQTFRHESANVPFTAFHDLLRQPWLNWEVSLETTLNTALCQPVLGSQTSTTGDAHVRSLLLQEQNRIAMVELCGLDGCGLSRPIQRIQAGAVRNQRFYDVEVAAASSKMQRCALVGMGKTCICSCLKESLDDYQVAFAGSQHQSGEMVNANGVNIISLRQIVDHFVGFAQSDGSVQAAHVTLSITKLSELASA